MVELGDELMAELKELGLSLEGLPEGAKSLSESSKYRFLDTMGRRIVYEPVGEENYRVRNILNLD